MALKPHGRSAQAGVDAAVQRPMPLVRGLQAQAGAVLGAAAVLRLAVGVPRTCMAETWLLLHSCGIPE